MICCHLIDRPKAPLNKAHEIILNSCLTVSIEGIKGKVEDPFLLFWGMREVTIGMFQFTIESFQFDCKPKKKTNLLDAAS